MRLAILLFLLSGCDIILGLERNPPGSGDALASECGELLLVKGNSFTNDVEMFNMFDRSELEGTVATVATELALTPRIPTGYVSITTNGPTLDFSSATAHVRIVKRADPPNTESYFSLHLDDDHSYYYSIDDGLGMGRKENGMDPLDLGQLGFDPQLHVWIGFRHDREPDQIVFETSVDGKVWVERHRIDVKFDLRTVRLRIGAGAYGPVGHVGSTTAVFDDFAFCR